MGATNGNGTATNGHAIKKEVTDAGLRRWPTKPKRRGFVPWILNVVARLAAWFVIFTILFRCPPTLEACDQSSPSICPYYFKTKNIVSPHVEPYYHRYAEPYVEIVQPYYDSFNDRVIVPTHGYAIQYGAPWAEKARAYGQAQWDKNAQPQIAKAWAVVQTNYDQFVAPRLSQVQELVGPYYDTASTNAVLVYQDVVLPGYATVRPYATRGYQVASDFTTGTALPTAYLAWNKTYAFVDSSVWPQVRAAYLENVDPQLVRIGERLGRYKNRVKAKSAPSRSDSDKHESSFVKPTPSSQTATPPTPEPPSKEQDAADFISKPVEPPVAAENESEKRRKAREMVTNDLETWQTKFAARADEGAQDMEDRVDEIAKRMITTKVHTTGRSLTDKLEATVESEMAQLRANIIKAVEGVAAAAEGTSADELEATAEAETVQAVRSAGVAIKEQAQAVRKWRQLYDLELQKTVTKAADVHFQILDETRNLALQKIGMQWAWTDGVTYKDWRKYHELKQTLQEWTDQLKQLIVTHPALLEAQDASAEVEDQSMEIASQAARELSRLREVALWKITARDTSDNFDSDAMKLAADEAVAAATTVAAEADVTEAEAVQEDKKEIEAATDADEDTASSHSVTPHDTEETIAAPVAGAGIPDPDVRGKKQGYEELIIGEASSTASGDDSEVTNAVSTASEEETAAPSSSELVTDEETSESATSSEVEPEFTIQSDPTVEADVVEESAAPEPVSKTEMIVDENKEDGDNAEEKEKEKEKEKEEQEQEQEQEWDGVPLSTPESEVESVKTQVESVKPAMFGAAAQAVSSREPVLEGYVDSDENNVAFSASAVMSNALAAASAQYSSAVSVVSAQIYGTPEPVHEELLSRVSKAYKDAIVAASSRFNNVLGAQATPTPTKAAPYVDWAKVESVAAERLNEGRLWAELQYQSAVIALGLPTPTPTPTSQSQRYLDEARKNYYAGIGLAQERYSSFLAEASAAMSSLTATPSPTATNFAAQASSAISAAFSSADQAYSSAVNSVGDAVRAVDEGVASAFDAASEQVYLTGGQVADVWENVVADLNHRIYGGEEQKHIGWYDSLVGEADKEETQREAVGELVSELVRGKEPSFTQSVMSRLSEVYATATTAVDRAMGREKDEL